MGGTGGACVHAYTGGEHTQNAADTAGRQTYISNGTDRRTDKHAHPDRQTDRQTNKASKHACMHACKTDTHTHTHVHTHIQPTIHSLLCHYYTIDGVVII